VNGSEPDVIGKVLALRSPPPFAQRRPMFYCGDICAMMVALFRPPDTSRPPARAMADNDTPSNPHDRFFKDLWTRHDVAADFLGRYLPQDVAALVDPASVRLSKDSFVDENLKAYYSDLLYEVTLRDGGPAYAYVLLEHKSTPERLTAWQLLQYVVRIWARAEAGRFTPVVSLVLYHGQPPWPYGQSLREILCFPEPFAAYAPDLRYALVDLAAAPDERIRGAVLLRAALLLMKHIRDPDLPARLPELVALWHDILNQPSGLQALTVLLRYLSAAAPTVTQRDLRRAITAALPQQEEMLMSTIAEEWVKQGEARGRAEGEARGQVKGQAAFLTRLLERRFGILPEAYRSRIANADAATLLAWGDHVLTAHSLDEVFSE
jgi:predicted transposase/invertase (TIGR01784 family)